VRRGGHVVVVGQLLAHDHLVLVNLHLLQGLSFHLSTRCRAAGIGGPLSACEVKFRYGGTCGKRLGERMASGRK